LVAWRWAFRSPAVRLAICAAGVRWHSRSSRVPARRPGYFLCANKESTQRKSPRFNAPPAAGCPVLLEVSGGCGTRPRCARSSNSPRHRRCACRNPMLLRCSAFQRGKEKRRRATAANPRCVKTAMVLTLGPVESAESRSATGKKAEGAGGVSRSTASRRRSRLAVQNKPSRGSV